MLVSEYEEQRQLDDPSRRILRRSRRRKGIELFLKIEVGSHAPIRFLWEYDEGLVLFVHERVNRGGKVSNAVCWKNREFIEKSGENVNCVYCNSGARVVKMFYWLVWDYRTRDYHVLSGKETSYSFVNTLRNFWRRNGTITDRDWKIWRTMMGGVSAYTAVPGPPSSSRVPHGIMEILPTRDDLVSVLMTREVRSLREYVDAFAF